MSSVQPRTLERLQSSQEAAAGVIELQPRLSAADFDIDFNETREHEKWTETKIMSHALTHDANILGQYLEVEAKLVPDPILRIRGTHKGQYMEDGYGRYGSQVDFDLVISLRDQVAHRAQFKIVGNSRKAYRGTRTKTNALSRDPEACLPAPSLDDWCRDFCAYSKGPKSFTFSRQVGALQKTVPIPDIKKLLRDVKYKGDIEVTVEAIDQTTTLTSDPMMARTHRNVFYWLLWIVFWFLSKRWEILVIEWPTRSSQLPGGDRGAGDMAAAWVEKWRVPIARAALYNLQERLYSAEYSAPGQAWKALGDFDEVREWGVGDEKDDV